MNRSTNQPTLRDLLRPVAAHRWLLLAIVAVAVAASVAYSATKKPVYQATASVQYQDETYALGLVGLAATPTQTADQLASAGAQTIIQPGVAARVKHQLHSPLSVDDLTATVSASVQPSSNLVDVTATAASAKQAQRLANAFALHGAEATNRQVRSSYAQAYSSAVKQVRRRSHNRAAAAALINGDQLSHLQVLSSIATAAQVVEPAPLPTAPSSPRLVRDALLATLLGVVLGLLAVYVRDSFDRRLRTVGDVEGHFAMPMLGHVRTEALGQSPRLNGNGGPAPVDWELFRILRRNLDFLEPNAAHRTVAVTSSLSEEGKSTVAAFLAFTSAAAGKRTLLIECDLRRPVLAERLKIEKSPGLSDYVLGHAEPSDILQVIRFGESVANGARGATVNGNGNGNGNGHASGNEHHSSPESAADNGLHQHELVCITAGSSTQHPVEILRSEAFAELLRQAPEVYDLVVLDTAPLLSVVDTLELLPQVDAAVLCVRVFSTTRQQAGAGRAALKRLPERPTGLVVTGTRRSPETDYGYYDYAS
ncbi:MAG TPA: Wzz/FepE/Etk N-terminal domain-containing protein [Solirubrobacteraceae bacterium]|jgi:receptor protein-tyrosine kinase